MANTELNIVVTDKDGERITIEVNENSHPEALAQIMRENELIRNIILESINVYAERYINPLEFVKFLTQNKN